MCAHFDLLALSKKMSDTHWSFLDNFLERMLKSENKTLIHTNEYNVKSFKCFAHFDQATYKEKKLIDLLQSH